MWYILTWTNHLNEKKTRDYSCPDALHGMIGTLIVNGYHFTVEACKGEQK